MNKIELNDIEKKVFKFMKNKDISNMSALQIAEYLYVSRTTIYRVCHKLGYKSFTHFKYMKTQENLQKINTIQEIEAYHLLDSAEQKYVDSTEMLIIIETIITAKHVYLIGTYATGIASQYLYRQLLNLGILATFIKDEFILEKYVEHLNEDDLIIFLSNSGSNIDIYRYVKMLKCKSVALTKKESRLHRLCNYSITFDFTMYSGDNSFDRENIFTLIVIIQRLLINLQKITEIEGNNNE